MNKVEILIALIIFFIALGVSGVSNQIPTLGIPLVNSLPTLFPLPSPTPNHNSSPTPTSFQSTSSPTPSFTPTPTSSATAKKVLSLGDSITAGGWKTPFFANEWYPCILKSSLGASFQFVGSQSSPSNICPGVNHEGYGGIQTSEFLSTKNPAQLAATYYPDIVLIHLGTNDIGFDPNFAANVTKNNIQQIVNAFKTHNPSVKIFVAKIISSSGNWNNGTSEEIDALNAVIPSITGAIIVDQYTGFNPPTDLFDAVHPNSSGSTKIADKFHSAIISNP